MKMYQLAALVFISACAPTLSGQLHGIPDRPFADDALINITAIKTHFVDGSGIAGKSLVLKVGLDGSFETKEALPVGEYLVEVLVPGYSIVTQHINTKFEDKINFNLRPLPPQALRTTHVQAGFEEGRGQGGVNLTPPNL